MARKWIERSSRGFTLIELLLVITVIAVLSTIVVTRMSSVEQQARVAVSLSNMADVQRAIEAYHVIKKGKYPDGWDSLLDMTDTTKIYGGNGDPLVNSGIPSNGWLTARPITTGELASMRRVSPTAVAPGGANNTFVTVYDHDPSASVTDANESTSDSAARLLGSPSNTDLNCAFVDPTTTAGQDVYRAFNLNPADTSFALLALGIGPRCTLVGDTQAGLSEAPVAGEVAPNQEKAYRRYVALFKVSGTIPRYFAEFVGVVTVYGKAQGELRAYLQ